MADQRDLHTVPMGVIDLFIMLYLRPISRFGTRTKFSSTLGRHHNSEASYNDNGPRLSTAYHPLFFLSGIMGVKELFRELPGGGLSGLNETGSIGGDDIIGFV